MKSYCLNDQACNRICPEQLILKCLLLKYITLQAFEFAHLSSMTLVLDILTHIKWLTNIASADLLKVLYLLRFFCS